MASTNTSDVPLVHHFEFSDGMRLQVNVTGFANGRNAKVELILRNSSRTWVLHWGCIFQNSKNWFVPAENPTGSNVYKQGALQTPFVKSGDVYVIVIQLHDSNICAIQFVLKDGRHNTWLKLNGRNFEIKIPKIIGSTTLPPIPKDVIERRAYQLWESRGRLVRSLQEQKQDYEDAVREVQALLAKGISLDELRRGSHTTDTKTVISSKEEPVSQRLYSCRRRHGIEQWIQRHNNKELVKNAYFPSSVLTNLVKKSIGGDDMLLQQIFRPGNYEIVVFSKIVGGNYHVVVAANTKGATLLHWGISKLHPGEWLTPPPDILPEKSKLLDAACQTHFMDSSAGNGNFQFVDINLQQRKILGIQFVIWSGGTWIKNNGANFCVSLNLSRSGKVEEDERCLKWLLDEISYREKEAERSLMHRFNIATELMDRCKTEGQLGLISILVWLRFMACRQLTWNKNYNVKPREISEAQERFTNLLQRIYLDQPNDREIVRLIMGCVGRGGQGDVGQRIRDEILVLQRNNDCKGGMMEEWHQKLHNNSSPDDVIICEALLNYVKSGFKIDFYWQTLNANGLSKEILASYDRPILSEPRLKTDTKEGLLRDLTSYLKTLKAVHSGADLESAIETCLCSFSKSFDVKNSSSAAGVSPKLQEYLLFVKEHIRDKNIAPLMEKLLESRIELRPALLTSHGRLKDFIFLDLALDSAVRTTIEGALNDLNFDCIPEIMFFIALVLESLCLSSVNNEALIYCTKDWYRLSESYKSNDSQWALQTKAILDRVRLILGAKAQYFQEMIQPSAQYLGRLLSVDQRVIENFTEELIRSGSAASLSMLVNRLDPVLRKIANLGSWQVISPVDANGLVVSVSELKAIQDKVYRNPTVIIANKVSGEEEIPEGVVAVLTADTPDVLSHVSIRARNNKVLFASCFDQYLFGSLKLKHGKAVSIQVRSTNLIISDISSYGVSRDIFISSSTPRVTLKNKFFSGKFAISVEDFSNQLVGAKSCNIRLLRQRVPSWIKIPVSVAIPFRVFETVLSQDINKDLASKIYWFTKLVDNGDCSKLKAIQETVLQMKAPFQLTLELQNKMKASRIPWPGDDGEARWNQAWMAIKKVWASKWNERAYISTRKAKLDHNNICMAVLVQEIICADYAFVIHTKNPISGDNSEIYTEIVKGLGETLVGAYPGRAMCFTTKKSNLKSPTVIGYPSKLVGLYVKRTIIFRSDSNGEDLEEYAGAGLYDSVTMDRPQEVVLDYSNDRLITDGAFRTSVFGKIADAGKIIEDIYGCAQDIEGVVKGGEIYVVQTRPQI